MSLYLYTLDKEKILKQKHWRVKILVDNFLPPSPTMPVTLPLSKIIFFVKAALNTIHSQIFCGLCISGFPILHKWLKSLTCTGVGIHTVTSPLNLSLFLEHWAPGIDMVQMFPCLYMLALRKLCYTPKKHHVKTLLPTPLVWYYGLHKFKNVMKYNSNSNYFSEQNLSSVNT